MELIINVCSYSGNDTELFTDERKEYYTQMLESVYNHLAMGMDLTALKSIIVPEDFKSELFSFQQSNGVSVGCTDNDMGVAHAQVVSYSKDGKVFRTIFIHKNIYFTLISDYEIELFDADEEAKSEFRKMRQLSINLIHHELAHVHEYAINERVNKGIYDKADTLIKLLREASQSVWSEYYACRFSSSTHIINFEEAKNIIEQAIGVDEKITEEINAYRIHGDINKIVMEIHTRTLMLFKYAAYFLGYSYVLSEERKNVIEVIGDSLINTTFRKTWRGMDAVLNNMYENLGNWTSPKVYDELGQTVCEY